MQDLKMNDLLGMRRAFVVRYSEYRRTDMIFTDGESLQSMFKADFCHKSIKYACVRIVIHFT